jgi:hypothetical protein
VFPTEGTIISTLEASPSGLSPDFPQLSPGVVTGRTGRADPQVSAALGKAQGPGGPDGIWPLCAIEIATPTSEAAISTDQKMIAM